MWLQNIRIAKEYAEFRTVQRQVNKVLSKDLSREGILKGADELGLLAGGTVVFDDESDAEILMDYCIYNLRDGQGRILIAQRPANGLLGGLWEFPGGKQEQDETLPETLRRELREELAIEVRVGELFCVVKHAFTHLKITLHAFECQYIGAMPPHDEPQCLEVANWAWVSEDELVRYSFGKADRMVIAQLQERRNMLL